MMNEKELIKEFEKLIANSIQHAAANQGIILEDHEALAALPFMPRKADGIWTEPDFLSAALDLRAWRGNEDEEGGV